MASAATATSVQESTTGAADHQSSATKSAFAHDAASHDDHDHAHSCNDPSHHHDMPSFFDHNDLFSSLAAAKKEVPAKRKNKKNPQQGVVRAENIPGHRGDQNIDELLSFINSPAPANAKKDKKKPAN